MLKCLEFELPAIFDNRIWDILEVTNMQKYYWRIIKEQSEVWCEKTNTDFFRKTDYSGVELKKQLRDNCRINFLKLQVYESYLSNTFELHTYTDFLLSDCKFIVLLYDNIFVEIYAKEHDIIKTLQSAAQDKQCLNINLISEKNFSRTKMDIL